MAQSEEASVEEILESIKKVIARDNRADAAATRRRRETAGVAAQGADAEEAPAKTDSDEVLDLAEMEFVEDADVASPVADTGSQELETDDMTQDDAPLTNENARENMRENLEALAMLAQPSAPPQIVRSGETSLEGLARDMLRPMLSEWLDANLPGMVEQMVQDEIARIVRKDK